MAAPMNVGHIVTLSPKKNPITDDFRPHERSGHCCVADNSFLYSIGGIFYDPLEIMLMEEGDNYNPVFNEIWCYNISLNLWSKVSMRGHSPYLTASMSSLLSGNMIITFGGSGFPFGAESDNRVHTFNVRTHTWKTMPCTGEKPHAKYGQAMVLVHNHYLYVYGGCRRVPSGAFLFDSDLHRVSLQSLVWEKMRDPTKEKLKKNTTRSAMRKQAAFSDKDGEDVENDDEDEAGGNDDDGGGDNNDDDIGDDEEEEKDMYPLAAGSYRHHIVNDEERLYIIGGGTLWREVYPLDIIHSFSYATSTWEILHSHGDPDHPDGFPSPRKYHTCVQKDNDVFITGGHNGYEVFDDIWKLTLPDLQWTRLAVTLPNTLFFHAAAMTPAGCMYVFGGVCNIENNMRTAGLHRIWLYIPSLQEICWHNILHFIPQIGSMSQEQLLALGIPRMFIDRLHWDKSVLE